MAIGQRPQRGSRLVDGLWLRGLSDGDNRSFGSGITAFAGGGQANATTLSAVQALIQVDVVVTAGDSVALPYATAGNTKKVFNKSANSMNVYAQSGLNKITGTLDVIGNTTNPTAYAIASGVAVEFFCPKDGQWVPLKSA